MSAPHPAVLEYPVAAPPAPGASIAVAPGILWLRMPLPFALDHINLWLLEDGDAWTLVDAGYGNAATRELWERHFATTLAGRSIARVIVTHAHPDHIGNAAWIAARFGCTVAMTHAEFLAVHAIRDEWATHGTADTRSLFAQHGVGAEMLAAYAARGNGFRRGVPEAPAFHERVVAGDELRAGDWRWRAIVGYGHSAEHMSLYAPAHHVLISGDMLLPKISTNVSVWPADPDGDPVGRFLASIGAYEDLPPHALVLPSHGLPFRGIPLRIAQLRAHHDARLAELLEAVRGAGAPVAAADVVPVLFPRALDLQQSFFAVGETVAHLNHLWRRGRLSRTRTADGTLRFAA